MLAGLRNSAVIVACWGIDWVRPVWSLSCNIWIALIDSFHDRRTNHESIRLVSIVLTHTQRPAFQFECLPQRRPIEAGKSQPKVRSKIEEVGINSPEIPY